MGALIPLALSLAPDIGKWLFGRTGEQVGAAVAQVARTVTGAGSDDEAAAAIARDPALAAQVRVRLAEIAAQREAQEIEAARSERAAELDALRAQLADVASARAQTVSLAQAGSRVQWAPVVVSVLVLATFGVVMWAALTRTLPAGSETILNMLLGTLAAMATSTVGYWVGSSAGSAQKTDLLYRSAPTDPGAAK